MDLSWFSHQLTNHASLWEDENMMEVKQSMALGPRWQGCPCKQVWNWTNVSLCISTVLSVVNKLRLWQSCILNSRLFWAGSSERNCHPRGFAALYWLQYVLCAEGDPNEGTKLCFIWCPTPKRKLNARFDKDNKDLSGIFWFWSCTIGYLVSIHQTCDRLKGCG